MTRNPRVKQLPGAETEAGQPDREALGRSRGGYTTKVHIAADTRCRPVARVVTAGQRHDSIAFEAVMANLRIERPGQDRRRTRPDGVLEDKAYSSMAIRTALRARRIKATIPSKANEITGRAHRGSTGGRPPAFDKAAYKTRNVVEATIQQAPPNQSSRDPLRQAGVRLPRHHRRRLDQDLAA
jgi:Transposase DDE domain